MNTQARSLFGQVDATYRHYPKTARSGPALALAAPQAFLKWTLIYPEALPIDPAQIDDAQLFLREELRGGRLPINNEVGFVVQHRCAEVLILYVCTWRNDNEVWETLYHKRVEPGARYAQLRRENTSPTFCVWVLPAVLHEQQAWTRYLLSARDAAAQQAYLDDGFAARV